MGRGRLKPLATEIGQLLLVSGYGRGHPSNRGTAAQSLTPMVIIRLTAAASKPKNPAGAQSYEHFQVRAIPRYVLGIRKENYPDLEEGGSGLGTLSRAYATVLLVGRPSSLSLNAHGFLLDRTCE